MLNDAAAAVLYQESTDQALAAITDVERTAQLDVERDEEEEHDMVQQDAIELDVARGIATDNRVSDASSVQDFENTIREASSRGT
jgi:hypothetical protein